MARVEEQVQEGLEQVDPQEVSPSNGEIPQVFTDSMKPEFLDRQYFPINFIHPLWIWRGDLINRLSLQEIPPAKAGSLNGTSR